MEISFDLSDGLARIAFDDGKKNAVTLDALDALEAAMDEAEAKAEAVVIIGRPGSFCAGFDMTGKRTSEIVTGSLASNFYIAGYRALLRRPEPLFTWHEMPMQITINSWDRIVLPLSDGAGRVTRILTCNMPGKPLILHDADSRRQMPRT